jgi:Uri superfamily endonuclease
VPGAYLLLIELSKVTDVQLSNKGSASLVPGRYLYAGSAFGPGGLKARIARHMRRAKVQRWHVDQLTKNGVSGAWIFPGCNECDLVDMNSVLPVPIVGFGSTDCKRCRSHLLGPIRRTPPNNRWESGMSAGTQASAGIEAKGTLQAEKKSDAERPLSN